MILQFAIIVFRFQVVVLFQIQTTGPKQLQVKINTVWLVFILTRLLSKII
jgi:hypothetical protein